MNRVMSAVPKELNIPRGDTFVDVLQLTANQISLLAGRTAVWFTLKRAFDDLESAALIQVTEGGGIVTLNGSSAVNSAWASIVVDEGLGTITLTIEANATQYLHGFNSHGFYDYQIRSGTSVVTLSKGRCYTLRDATRSI